jgi:signal transduction histidine kinase
MSKHIDTSKAQKFRENAIRYIVGRAISHDLRSPSLHFQDKFLTTIDRYESTNNVGKGEIDQLRENLNDFNITTQRNYDTFRDIATDIRKKSGCAEKKAMNFDDIYITLRSRARPLVKDLEKKIEDLTGEAISKGIIGIDSREKTTFNRFKITLSRLYFALETITDPTPPEQIETINLSTTLRKLFEAAVPNNHIFEFKVRPEPHGINNNLNMLKPTIHDSNREKITSILQNILLNALRFADESEEKLIYYYWESGSFSNLVKNTAYEKSPYNPGGKWLLYHILNSGKRIAKDFEPKLFDFAQQRGKTHDRYGGGSGVGLAIAKLMISDVGGLIYYNAAEDKLTDFCLLLPIYSKDRIPSETIFATEYEKAKFSELKQH